MKTAATKLPKKGRGFTWSRGIRHDGLDGGPYVQWRLHRFDRNGTLHASYVCAGMKAATEGRAKIATMLRDSYRQLRDLVDEIDIRILEEEENGKCLSTGMAGELSTRDA